MLTLFLLCSSALMSAHAQHAATTCFESLALCQPTVQASHSHCLSHAKIKTARACGAGEVCGKRQTTSFPTGAYTADGFVATCTLSPSARVSPMSHSTMTKSVRYSSSHSHRHHWVSTGSSHGHSHATSARPTSSHSTSSHHSRHTHHLLSSGKHHSASVHPSSHSTHLLASPTQHPTCFAALRVTGTITQTGKPRPVRSSIHYAHSCLKGHSCGPRTVYSTTSKGLTTLGAVATCI